MMEYSKKMVRCNLCQNLISRDKDIKYSAGYSDNIKVPCPKCKKGNLWLFDIKVDKERMKKERYKLDNPTNGEKISNGMHRVDMDRPDRKINFGTRLQKGFEMLGDDN